MLICGRCGEMARDINRFCQKCGFTLEAATPAHPATQQDLYQQANDIFDGFSARLHRLASTDRLENFSISQMFSEVFRKRSPEEVEEYFLTGTSRATPPIEAVDTGWPKPWFFFRVLAFLLVVYFGFSAIMQFWGNAKAIPGMIIMGSLSFPLATLILFFEFNTPRNVTVAHIILLLAFGGMLSLLVTHIGVMMASLNWLGAMSAGIVEESAKLLTVIVLVRSAKFKYILNGLLFGAAVGAGFEVFEMAGYAFEQVMATKNLSVMEHEITLRALTAPFGHAAWTAISAGALWRTRAGRPLDISMLWDARFLKTFLIPVGLHMFYNSPLPNPLFVKEAVVAVASWIVILGLVQQGLKQVREEQQQVAQAILASAATV